MRDLRLHARAARNGASFIFHVRPRENADTEWCREAIRMDQSARVALRHGDQRQWEGGRIPTGDAGHRTGPKERMEARHGQTGGPCDRSDASAEVGFAWRPAHDRGFARRPQNGRNRVATRSADRGITTGPSPNLIVLDRVACSSWGAHGET